LRSLRKVVGDRDKLSKEESREVVKQLAETLQCMQREDTAHRDIKMYNMLID
jgi:serine/threonine protein kinase